MKVQTVQEYAKEKGISVKTVTRYIESGNFPSFVDVKPLYKRGFVIITDHCELCASVESACIEYNKRCGRSVRPDIAAELSIKYGINTAKLFRILGI